MDQTIVTQLTRIADALDRLSPPPCSSCDLTGADAFVWHSTPDHFSPVTKINRVDLSLLKGIERQAHQLLANTLRFAKGLPANNALLWGARGTGKSSLVKAVHAQVLEMLPASLALVEIHREDIVSLPRLLTALKSQTRPVILFCDDLTFESHDDAYTSLKAVLEGGVEGRPDGVVFYATSNRRHLMSRSMIENEQSTAIDPGEAVEEKVSLSDRFGLWLGFHNMDQETYFQAIEGYAKSMELPILREELRRRAIEWSMTRGARSGRVAWQFIQDLAGELGAAELGMETQS
jgi:hypothetical protein